MDNTMKAVISAIVALILAVSSMGTSWMGRIEDRLLYIGDNYATKTEVQRLDRNMSATRLEIIAMLKNLGEEIRDARKETRNWQKAEK